MKVASGLPNPKSAFMFCRDLSEIDRQTILATKIATPRAAKVPRAAGAIGEISANTVVMTIDIIKRLEKILFIAA